ncbi:MAG: hopanoid biosynthesis-associated protein HpnK [Alphaproteobacteria bacterium]|nr:hopanoid biosynthesis-associated protein HpnK [Alphaproteobacteria bacterium]
MRGLIVTADDFGAAREVNDAVEIAHRDGILTAASLMVAAPAAADAVKRAKAMPQLGVGLHLVLVEGRPMMPPSTIPALVGADGNFRLDMVRESFEMVLRASLRRQLAEEIEAQFQAFAATGLKLDHVNTHKHFHLHPVIAGLILSIGRKYGLRSMRVPYEPPSLLRRIEPVHGTGRIERIWARHLRRRLGRAGVWSPDRVFGLAWSGAMTAARLTALLSLLPDGITEIYTHPATAGGFAGAAQGYRYGDELAAVASKQLADFTRENGIRRGSFRDFE